MGGAPGGRVRLSGHRHSSRSPQQGDRRSPDPALAARSAAGETAHPLHGIPVQSGFATVSPASGISDRPRRRDALPYGVAPAPPLAGTAVAQSLQQAWWVAAVFAD